MKYSIENFVYGEIDGAVTTFAEQEIRDIYCKKGYKEDLLEEIVRIITSRRKVWIDTMMREELGLIEGKYSPVLGAVKTFLGFNAIGIIPLIHFIFIYVSGFNISTSNACFIQY